MCLFGMFILLRSDLKGNPADHGKRRGKHPFFISSGYLMASRLLRRLLREMNVPRQKNIDGRVSAGGRRKDLNVDG